MNCADCKESVKESAAASRIMADAMQKVENTNRRLWVVIICLIVCIVAMAVCMVYIAVNGQDMVDNAMWKALNGAGDVTTTTTTTVDQDTGEGSGNNGYQAGEHATYHESEAD